MQRFQVTGPGMWDFQWMGTDMVSFRLPGIEQEIVLPVSNATQVQYGAAVMEAEDFIFIFGTEDAGDNKYAHVARVRNFEISGSWQYYSQNGWSVESANTCRMLAGVANQYSVVPVGGEFLLMTMDTRVPFGNRLVAYRSENPFGPWFGPVLVYTAPEAHGDVIAYNAFAHPQFSDGDLILVSYNLNHISDAGAIYENADWYRPKFIRVDLQQLSDAFDATEVGRTEK
jgi:hypothetical protein